MYERARRILRPLVESMLFDVPIITLNLLQYRIRKDSGIIF